MLGLGFLFFVEGGCDVEREHEAESVQAADASEEPFQGEAKQPDPSTIHGFPGEPEPIADGLDCWEFVPPSSVRPDDASTGLLFIGR